MRKLAALLIALFACVAPAQAREFTDSLGRTVTLPDEVSRVLPAGPPAAVAIYTVAPEKLAGWVRPLKPDQLNFIVERYRSLPVVGRLTGKEAGIGTAEVKALHPDLIIDIGDLDPEYRALADKIQSETGIPYVVLDGSLANTPQLYTQLSQLLNGGLMADMLAVMTAGDLAHIAGLKATALRPARVYFARDRSAPEAGSMGNMSGIDQQVLDALGAISIAGHQAVTVGQVADRNPDLILTENAEIAKKIRSDPEWRQVPAAAAGKVYVVPSLPFGWLGTPPGVNRLIGLEWLSALLYPGTPKVDLAAETRRFYRNYYKVDLTDAQLQQLLGP